MVVLLAGIWLVISGGHPADRAPVRSATTAVPASLAAAASAMIGAESHGFAVTRRRGLLVASGGGVSSAFSRGGVRLVAGDAAVRMSLLGVGYGDRLAASGDVAPVAHGSSVSYRRDGVREWYRNGPFGLEQGFTLSRRPPAGGRGPLSLALGLRGSLVARRSGSGLVFAAANGRAVLRYDGLSARDATGRLLHAVMVPGAHGLTLRVWDSSARYPLTIDPFIEQSKLTAPTTGADAEIGAGVFGWSVAISADGTTALIGAPRDPDPGNIGAVWVFTQSGGTWTEQKKLLAPTAGGDAEIGTAQFGKTLALSPDGSTALIGGPGDHGNVGAAWTYARSGTTWTEQSKLIAPTAGGDMEIGAGQFGYAVAMSADGTTALVGGAIDNTSVGAAWAYARSGTTWTEQTKLIAPTAGSDMEIGPANLGFVVALSADGTTALLGGTADNTNVGAAWAFTRSGTTWTEQSKLTAPTTGTDAEIGVGNVGFAVAVSADGTTALLGGIADHSSAGAAWAFTRSGTTWSEQSKLTAPTTGTDAEIGGGIMGYAVTLSADGTTALVGAPGDHSNTGAAWTFTRAGTTWTEQSKLTAPTSGRDAEIAGGEFGWAVAWTPDGTTSLIGGLGDDTAVGASWVFVNRPVVSNVNPPSGSAGGGTPVTIAGTDLAAATSVTFGGVPAASFAVVSPTEIDAISPPGPAAPVDIVVSTPGGTSALSLGDRFTYFASAPAAPTGVSATPGNAQATVSFAAPPSNGSAITTYTVTASPGGAHASGAGSPITVTGLANATSYTFTATATNAVGTSPPSSPSNAVTPTAPIAHAAVPAAPSASHAALTGVAHRKPKLAFTVAAARSAAPLKTITVGLPSGLSFSTKKKSLTHDVTAKDARGKAVKHTVKVSHGALTITLTTAQPSVRVTIASPELSSTKALAAKVKGKKGGRLTVTIKVTNSRHVTTRLTAKLTAT